MKNILLCWDRVKKELSNNYIMLFLDYDGTLAPIAVRPNKAITPQKTQGLLKKLSGTPGYKIVIISGRSLKDIKRRINIKDIIYVGNHGVEIEGPKIKFASRIPSGYRVIIERIKSDLHKKLLSIKGVILEDKGFSLSIHFRLADKKQIPEVKTIIHESIITCLIANKIKIKSGKMVMEINPPVKWDKGKAALWLLARQQAVLKGKGIFSIYIGDDLTDEDAFKVLKNKGLTIFVGKPKASSAQYYLNDPNEVAVFLGKILKYNMMTT